jgi:mRNA interferase MazF
MRRGDLVTVAAPGDYGKPRPAVIVQADALTAGDLSSVVLCLISSQPVNAPTFRITVEPNEGNGLRERSQLMVDKLLTVPRARLGPVIGRLDEEALLRLNRTLAFVVGLAE